MPATAFSHFGQDLARATAMTGLAAGLPATAAAERLLRDDVLRGAWMLAVGAFDAYFCDAYTDIVAATIIAKSRHAATALPDFFHDIRFPIRAILEPYTDRASWRWRMAARKMMERESVLSLAAVQTLFNKFFRPGQKLFRDLLPAWIVHPAADRRVFGVTAARFATLSGAARGDAISEAQTRLEDRFRDIFQRRHDCIHNCDRPRVKPQPMPIVPAVRSVLADIGFLVSRCDEHVNAEFRQFLLGIGCPAAIIGQGGY